MNPRRAWMIGAALAAAILADAAGAATLGRLFYTPDQRARLDRQDAGDAGAAPDEMLAQPRRIDGIVRRSGGPATVWVDGAPVRVQPGRGADGPTIEGDRVVVRGQDGRPVRLRPGEAEGRP